LVRLRATAFARWLRLRPAATVRRYLSKRPIPMRPNSAQHLGLDLWMLRRARSHSECIRFASAALASLLDPHRAPSGSVSGNRGHGWSQLSSFARLCQSSQRARIAHPNPTIPTAFSKTECSRPTFLHSSMLGLHTMPASSHSLWVRGAFAAMTGEATGSARQPLARTAKTRLRQAALTDDLRFTRQSAGSGWCSSITNTSMLVCRTQSSASFGSHTSRPLRTIPRTEFEGER